MTKPQCNGNEKGANCEAEGSIRDPIVAKKYVEDDRNNEDNISTEEDEDN